MTLLTLINFCQIFIFEALIFKQWKGPKTFHQLGFNTVSCFLDSNLAFRLQETVQVKSK